MSIIKIRNLTKYYGKARGVADVSLSINDGEIFGFIGPNGAGKSTTIRTMLSFIYPTSGSCSIFGMDCVKDGAKIKREIGYIPSEVNYYDDMKVKELFVYSAKFYKMDCSQKMKELCDIFELETDRKIEDLSFGNRKKVAIVQALIHNPRLLIMDEPTGGLDPLMQNKFFEVIREENKKGVTVFFSSHILSEVQKLCNRVAIIKEGKILKVEQVEKLRAKQYKRVRVEYKNEGSISGFDVEGISDISIKKNRVDFLYNGSVNTLVGILAGKNIENLWIEEPSLEEVFMHYYEKEEI